MGQRAISWKRPPRKRMGRGGVREDLAEGHSGSDAGRRSETSAAMMRGRDSAGRRAALGSEEETGAKRVCLGPLNE